MSKQGVGVFCGLLFVITAVLLLNPQVARADADEIGELKEQLAQQNKILMEMQKKIASLEAKQSTQNEALTKEISKVSERKFDGVLPDSIKWVEN